MDFIPAEDLKKRFDITGSFYELEINNVIYKCRNRLDIKSKENINTNQPDIIVVMMNPGSSKPIDNEYIEKRYTVSNLNNLITSKLIETKPDNTQYQIMRLMLERELNHAIVLNLSDLRNGKSGEFSKIFNSLSIIDYSHPDSILNDLRKKEFDSIIENYSQEYILVGWGNLKNQEEFMKKAIDKFSKFKLIGIKSNNCTYCYGHPSPQQKMQKINWLKEIIEQMKT